MEIRTPFNFTEILSRDPRAFRGCQIIAKGDMPRQLDENTFELPSQSGNGLYTVKREGTNWICSCPDHLYRLAECKHIHAVKFYFALKGKIQGGHAIAPRPIVRPPTPPERLICAYCGSVDLIKNGVRNNKAGKKIRYLCKSCNRTFIHEDGFKRVHYDPKVVTVALDLYFKGTSLRKIQDHMRQFYNLNLSHTTIHFWIRKYMELVDRYVSTLQPQTSMIWHADEMMVKAGGKYKWLWHVMDGETRFMLSNLVSEKRSIIEAKEVVKQAKETASQKPALFVTDGLFSYREAYRKELRDLHRNTTHVAGRSLKDTGNNNRIERLHGTVRER